MASVITLAFENWKAQEAASGKAVLLDEFVFANVPNLEPTQPIDRNEKLPPANQIVHRQAVNKAGLASENAVAYSVTMGADVGNFDFNWIGLLNKASGTVAMITHAPTQKKLKTQNGQQGNVLTRSFILEFQGAAEETQIKTSAETWQIDFTARLSGIDEMQRLINVDSYGAAAFFNDGFEVIRSGEQYTVQKGLGYVGGLRGELAQNQILNGLRNTKVYADFSYQGNIVSQWRTVIKITAAATLNNYVDAAGFTHQVFAIASIDASGNVKDLRPMGALSSQEIAALETRFKLDLSKKIDKANITSQTGNSTELVVNQHLLTTELGKKQPLGNYAPAGDYATNAALNNGLKGKFDKIGGTVAGKTTVTATGSAISIQPVGSDRIHYDFLNQDGTRAGYIGFGGTANPNSFQIVNDRNGLIVNIVDGKILVNDQPILTTRDITQSKGTSTSLVMSQDAATKNFASTTLTGSQSFNSSIYAKESIRATDASGSTGIFRKDGRSFISVVNGTNFIELSTPNKSGTLALTSDIPTSFGAGKYIDVSASRSSGVTYTNTGATPRVVFISITKSVSNPKVTFFVDGVEVGYTYNSSEGALTSGMFIVPIGSTYSFNANSSVRIMELN
ncbi:phage tail protein [Providencia rettgeri]|uniref:phage tail protein n=1 Tax=Providencia rettgeri TaxID=587 RepID=UPI0022312271